MPNRTIQKLFLTYEEHLSMTPQPLKNRKAIYAISHCRTAEMGTSYYACDNNHVQQQHHSCRHRSCFLCAQKSRLDWVDKQRERLLDVPHFHVVFTLPHEYLPLWRFNEAQFVDLIFKASKETLIELIGDEKYHNVTPGILMALHTWGRQLSLHPHTHCLVTAGGLTKEKQWQDIDQFLLAIRVVKTLYRAKMQALILELYEAGKLSLPDSWSEHDFESVYRATYKKEWSVRIEERYEHGKGVMLYLSRYLKGGPINPKQITSCSDQSVSFRYLDHRDKRRKQLSIDPKTFIERLLTHVPAIGKHMVRTYGIYAGCNKTKHRLCAERVGTLKGSPVPGLTVRDMLLFCSKCGTRNRLVRREWCGREKGNSINKEAPEFQHRANGSVQQEDEVDIAREFGRALPKLGSCSIFLPLQRNLS